MSFGELLLIVVIAMLVLKPEDLQKNFTKLAKLVGKFQNFRDKFQGFVSQKVKFATFLDNQKYNTTQNRREPVEIDVSRLRDYYNTEGDNSTADSEQKDEYLRQVIDDKTVDKK